MRAPRGILYDRNGQVLVENRHSFTISIVREHTKDLDRTIRLLASVVGLEAERDVKAIVTRHHSEPTYRPIVIVEDASLAQVAAITARRLDFELPDVVVEEVPTRRYPQMAAHLFGYVGEVNDDDDRVRRCAEERGDLVGQAGIEKIYNALLMGEDGAKHVVVNSLGREIRTLDEEAPTEGKRLQLTIDYDLQEARSKTDSGNWRPLRRASRTPAPPWSLIRIPAKCSRFRASPRTTRTRSRRASIARRGRRSTATNSAR